MREKYRKRAVYKQVWILLIKWKENITFLQERKLIDKQGNKTQQLTQYISALPPLSTNLC